MQLHAAGDPDGVQVIHSNVRELRHVQNNRRIKDGRQGVEQSGELGGRLARSCLPAPSGGEGTCARQLGRSRAKQAARHEAVLQLGMSIAASNPHLAPHPAKQLPKASPFRGEGPPLGICRCLWGASRLTRRWAGGGGSSCSVYSFRNLLQLWPSLLPSRLALNGAWLGLCTPRQARCNAMVGFRRGCVCSGNPGCTAPAYSARRHLVSSSRSKLATTCLPSS